MANLTCKNCGADIPEGARACPMCYTAVSDEAETATPKASTPAPALAFDFNKYKKYILLGGIALGALIVILLLVTVLGSLFTPSKYTLAPNDLVIYELDGSVILETAKKKVEIEGELSGSRRTLDGKNGIVIVSTDESGETVKSVYDLNGKLLVEEVGSVLTAPNSPAFLYTIYNQEDGTMELSLFDGKTSKMITDEAITDGITISPDGKAVTYVVRDGEETTAYLYKGGKNAEIGDDILPRALSNGAGLIYYEKEDSFYVQKGTNRDKRVKLGSFEGNNSLMLNSTHTECIFRIDDKTYITVKGGDKIRLKAEYEMPLAAGGYIPSYSSSSSVITLGIDSFKNTFYASDDALNYINSKYEVTRAVRGAEAGWIASDNKTVIYMKDNNSIYSINGTNENAEPKELVDGEADNLIAVLPNGAGFFYVSEDEEILFQKGAGKPKVVTDEFDCYSNMYLFKNKTQYYAIDDEVFASTGGRGKTVKGIDLDEVLYINCTPNYVQVRGNLDGESVTYRSWDGTSFKLVDAD